MQSQRLPVGFEMQVGGIYLVLLWICYAIFQQQTYSWLLILE